MKTVGKVLGVILGLLCFAAGIYCLFTPGLTFLSIGWIVPVALIVAGVGAVAKFIASEKKSLAVLDIVWGLVAIALGVIFLFLPEVRAALDFAMIYIFAGWVLVGGILRILAGIRMASAKVSLWGIPLAVGIIFVLLGGYSFFHPLVSLFAIGYLIAFWLMMGGINIIVGSTVEEKTA